jgi:virginiamycin B lyase
VPSGSATSATRRSRVSIRPPTASPAASRWVRSPAASSLVRARSGWTATAPEASSGSIRKRARSCPRIPVGPSLWDIEFGADAVWATSEFNGTVSRIDSATDAIVATIKVGTAPRQVRYGAGAIWVGSHAGKSIYRVDPSTNKARAVPVGLLSPDSIAVSDAAIWVTSSADRVAVRLNSKTLRVVARVTVGLGSSNAAIAGDGSVFVPSNGDGTVSRIDPVRNKVVATYKVGPNRYPAAPSAMSGFLSQAGGRSCGSTSADSTTSQRGDRAPACEHAHACGAGSPLHRRIRGVCDPLRGRRAHLRLHGRCVRPRPRAVVGRRGRRYAGRVGQPWASWMAHVAGRDRGSRVEASRGHRRAAHPLPARPCRRAPGYRDDARGDRRERARDRTLREARIRPHARARGIRSRTRRSEWCRGACAARRDPRAGSRIP